MGAGEFNQEAGSAKINIEEHVGQDMVIQQFLEKFDATGKIVAYHSCKTSRYLYVLLLLVICKCMILF